MRTKNRKQAARARHRVDKKRNRYKKVLKQFEPKSFREDWSLKFKPMIEEIVKLHPKVLEIMLSDLNKMYVPPWSGDYHRLLINSVEMAILERTVLK